jgi:hypothetical protein
MLFLIHSNLILVIVLNFNFPNEQEKKIKKNFQIKKNLYEYEETV